MGRGLCDPPWSCSTSWATLAIYSNKSTDLGWKVKYQLVTSVVLGLSFLVYNIKMPYIAPKDRKKVDPLIDKLAEQIVKEAKAYDNDAAFAGLLNYASTRLALKVVRLLFGGIRYWIIATVVGTFHNVADEFYRRLGIPYENKQIKKSGDVDLYAEYEKELE